MHRNQADHQAVQPMPVSGPTTFALSSRSSHSPIGLPSEPSSSLSIASASTHIDRQAQMAESYLRSVTLVFWYKANCAPVRLHQEVSTFPFLQLSQFAQLVQDLGLSPTSYVDMFNPRAQAWEQQTISAVRVVESEQRLLVRMRKTILVGLDDTECPSLDDEVAMQPRAPPLASRPIVKKRTASQMDDASPGLRNKSARIGPLATSDEQYPLGGSANNVPPSPTSEDNVVTTISGTQDEPSSSTRTSRRSPRKQDHFVSFTPPVPAQSPPVTILSLPLAKRWPNDYTVYEISDGFGQMDILLSQKPSLTQRIAFEEVFGCRYVKSTVCRHRGVWLRAGKDLRHACERMGLDATGLWTEFLKRVEGGTRRSDVSGRGRPRHNVSTGEMTLVMAPQTTPMGPVSPVEDLVPREKAPIMGSLGTPPPDLDPKTLETLQKRPESMLFGLSRRESESSAHEQQAQPGGDTVVTR